MDRMAGYMDDLGYMAARKDILDGYQEDAVLHSSSNAFLRKNQRIYLSMAGYYENR